MLGRCFALAFLLFFSGKSFAGNDNYTRAADTFKAIEKLYGVEDVPLFRETYPFDNHLSNRNYIPICGLFRGACRPLRLFWK